MTEDVVLVVGAGGPADEAGRAVLGIVGIFLHFQSLGLGIFTWP